MIIHIIFECTPEPTLLCSRNIYKEEELERDITCAKFAHMGTEGDQQYEYTAYNLDMYSATTSNTLLSRLISVSVTTTVS